MFFFLPFHDIILIVLLNAKSNNTNDFVILRRRELFSYTLKTILAIGVCYILDMVIVWKQYPRQEFENETAKFEAAFLKHAQKL